MRHNMVQIAEWYKTWGKSAEFIFPAPKNNSVFLFLGSKNTPERKAVFQNKIIAEFTEPLQFNGLAFSPNGLKVAMKSRDAGGTWIYINENIEYRPKLKTVHYMDWIDNENLAFDGWYGDENGRMDSNGIRYFINGEDKTDVFRYMPFAGGSITVAIPGRIYTRLDDGTIIRDSDFSWDNIKDHDWYYAESDRIIRFNKDGPESLEKHPEIEWSSERDEIVGIKYRGKFYKEAAVFDKFTSGGFGDAFVLSKDKTSFAYIGAKYSWLSKKLISATMFFYELGEKKDGGERYWAYIFAYPAAILANPYFGPLNIYLKMSERHQVVKNGQIWPKKYKYINAGDLVFTPDNKLAAKVDPTGNSCCVAIDTEEGPYFDEIYNLRYLADEKCLCYLGLKDHKFYRVTVST